jgi:type IV secretory pathway VirB2 component (pilin)
MNLNTVTIAVGRDTVAPCKIYVNQSINATTVASGQLKLNGLAEIKRDITNGLQAQVNQASAATSQLGGGQSSTADNTTINNHIENLIETNITDETYQNALAQSLGSNDGTLVIGRDCKDEIHFDQNIVSQVTAINLLDKVQQLLDSDSVVANFNATVAQTATSKSEGLAGLVQSIFDGIKNAFTGPYSMIAIACVVLCCIACLALLAFGLSPAGQQATVTAANTASEMAKSGGGMKGIKLK